MNLKEWLIPTSNDLFFSKNDLHDPRLGDFAKPVTNLSDLQKSDLVLVGYPDDEGIRLNGGRPGAALAPNEIRKYFYKMTPHLRTSSKIQIQDLGNLKSDAFSVNERHERARSLVQELNKINNSWISLGGGHDYGYSDACGFLDVHKDNALILNWDSHLDVRPYEKEPHSGTPFYRTLSEFKNKFSFYELGIQDHCNSKSHLNWAQEHGAQVVFQNELQNTKQLQSFLSKLPKNKNLKVFLSVDIDGFSNQVAPGCSQSWATGLPLQVFLKLLQYLQTHYQVCGMGIYEVSPPLDQDNRTSKLAALLMHHFTYGMHPKS